MNALLSESGRVPVLTHSGDHLTGAMPTSVELFRKRSRGSGTLSENICLRLEIVLADLVAPPGGKVTPGAEKREAAMVTQANGAAAGLDKKARLAAARSGGRHTSL